MANNIDAQQTHHYDQNAAFYTEQVDILMQAWQVCEQTSCCPEHTVINFFDCVIDSFADATREDVAAMITFCAKRIAHPS